MELSTRQTLAGLNRRFYEQHAENFADSRPRLQPGVRRLLSRISPGARVLEVGCGDGKVARALPQVQYTGLDQSAALLQRAIEYTTKDERRTTKVGSSFVLGRPKGSFVFLQADLLSLDLPPGPFDWVLAFAVFHHLPGRATRQSVLQHLAGRLTPTGTIIMSNWQFHTSPRFLLRQAPWSALGLTEADVEPGDALLTWERKGRHGLRYVHALDETEARRLAAAAGLAVTEVFASDGINGALAEYVVAKPFVSLSPNSPVSW